MTCYFVEINEYQLELFHVTVPKPQKFSETKKNYKLSQKITYEGLMYQNEHEEVIVVYVDAIATIIIARKYKLALAINKTEIVWLTKNHMKDFER